MLLRSITKHLKEQNWFAVGLDFLVVVIGILIAFQVSTWNETRQEREAERALIANLEVDFTTLKETLEQRFSRAKRLMKSTSKLIELIRHNQEPADTAEMKRLLLNASLYNAPVARPTSFTDGLQSGRISSLQSSNLRQALNDYTISTDWWATVRGAPEPQTDPNSVLNKALVWEAEKELDEALSRELGGYDWSKVLFAERELVVIHRRQTLQAEAYRLELVEVEKVLGTIGLD